MSSVNQQYLKDKDGNNFSPITSTDSIYLKDGSTLQEFINKMSVTTLYNNINNTSGGSVTLSDNAKNYTYLDVFLKSQINDKPMFSCRLMTDDTTTMAAIPSSFSASTDAAFSIVKFNVSDRTLGFIVNSYFIINSNSNTFISSQTKHSTNFSSIVRVLGYKF